MSTALTDQIMKTFAKKLKAAREAAGYDSAERFAHALGIDPHTYRHYERGRPPPGAKSKKPVQPNLTTLTRICQLLSVSPNDLLPLAASSSVERSEVKKGGAGGGQRAA